MANPKNRDRSRDSGFPGSADPFGQSLPFQEHTYLVILRFGNGQKILFQIENPEREKKNRQGNPRIPVFQS